MNPYFQQRAMRLATVLVIATSGYFLMGGWSAAKSQTTAQPSESPNTAVAPNAELPAPDDPKAEVTTESEVAADGAGQLETPPTADGQSEPIAGDIESTEPDATGMDRTDALLASLTIFVLAVFLGFEVITKVPPTLHTPLMSGSNAISGITLVGAILMAGTDKSLWAAVFGMLAVIMAMINVMGGFLVTDRMLSMFQRR